MRIKVLNCTVLYCKVYQCAHGGGGDSHCKLGSEGGALTLEGSAGMYPPYDPPFQALFQLQRPNFYFSKKFVFSSPILAEFQLLKLKFC